MAAHRAFLAVALGIVLPGWAAAAPIWFSGVDVVDETAGTSRGWLETTEGGSGAATDAYPVTQNLSSLGQVHSAANGGSDLSKWAAYYTPTGTNTRWSEYTLPTSKTTVAFGGSLRAEAAGALGAAVDVVAAVESGGLLGCGARLNTDRTITLWYRDVATHALGTSGEKTEDDHCSGDPLVECTSGGQCPSALCTACNVTTGAGCYWGGIEVVQTNITPSVRCELWWDGRRVIQLTVAPTVPPATVTAVRWGVLAKSASATVPIHWDDVGIEDGTRFRFGYVQRLVPTGSDNATARQWGKNACGGLAVEHDVCVDRYGTSPFELHAASYLAVSANNRTDDFTDMTAPETPAVGASIAAVGAAVVGRAGGATDATLTSAILYCDSATTCLAPAVANQTTVTVTGTSDHLLAWHAAAQAPISGGQSWSLAALQRLGHRIRSADGNTQRVQEILHAVRIIRPDASTPAVIGDHNKGTDDSVIAVYTTGDSLNGATLSSTCQGGTKIGEPCTSGSPYYCSWDPHRDDPDCNGDNTICQVCTGSRTEAGGFKCTVGTECPQTGGTCAGDGDGDGIKEATCDQNENIPCDVAADCNGHGGSCDTAATCIEACPGSTCPGGGAWGAHIAGLVGADLVVACSKGGEHANAMVLNRVDDTLAGADGLCKALIGTGVCGCTTAADCDSGTCTNSRCVGGADGACASSAVCKSCTLDSECGTEGQCSSEGKCACHFAPPDVLVVLEGVNDMLTLFAPTCNEPDALLLSQPNSLCDRTSTTTCTADSGCTGVSPTSWCTGFDASTQGGGSEFPCRSGSLCTASIAGCRVTSDCSLSQTCTVNEPSALESRGHCQCANDTQCASGFKCVGSICRRACTSDAQCLNDVVGVTAVAGVCNGTVCIGRCTTPCDVETCATDVDCDPVTSTAIIPGTSRGRCISGRCTDCGYAACELNPDHVYAYRQWYGQRVSTHFGLQYQAIEAKIAAWNETDGRPIVMGVTHPRYFTQENACTLRWAQPSLIQKGNAYIRKRMTYVADLGAVFADVLAGTLYKDLVHFALPGGELGGLTVAERLNAINTCAVGKCLLADQLDGPPCGATTDCTGGATCIFNFTATPQRYCRSGSGTWTSEPCEETTDPCTGTGEVCSLRPCACVCRTTEDCLNWFGAGQECVEANDNLCDPGDTACWCQRASDNVDSCDVVFDTGGQTWTCDTTTDKRCENAGADACPASADMCRPE